MERTRIDSDALRSVGFDQAKGLLEVEFSTGLVYEYSNVSLGEVVELMISPSRGNYFNHTFKPLHPRYRQLS
jgi:KTSC domain